MDADRAISFFGGAVWSRAGPVGWSFVWRLAASQAAGSIFADAAVQVQAQRGAKSHALHVSSVDGVVRMRVVACGWARNMRAESGERASRRLAGQPVRLAMVGRTWAPQAPLIPGRALESTRALLRSALGGDQDSRRLCRLDEAPGRGIRLGLSFACPPVSKTVVVQPGREAKGDLIGQPPAVREASIPADAAGAPISAARLCGREVQLWPDACQPIPHPDPTRHKDPGRPPLQGPPAPLSTLHQGPASYLASAPKAFVAALPGRSSAPAYSVQAAARTTQASSCN